MGDKIAGAIGGAVLSMGTAILHISPSQWVMDASLQLAKVAFFGIIGGAAGVLGKKLMEKYFFKPKKQ